MEAPYLEEIEKYDVSLFNSFLLNSVTGSLCDNFVTYRQLHFGGHFINQLSNNSSKKLSGTRGVNRSMENICVNNAQINLVI